MIGPSLICLCAFYLVFTNWKCSSLKILSNPTSIDETVIQSIDITSNRKSLIETTQTLCRSLVDKQSVVRMEAGCDEIHFLKPVLDNLKNTQNQSWNDQLICGSRSRRNLHSLKPSLPQLRLVKYHNVLESITDLMLHWKRFRGLFIVDQNAGLDHKMSTKYLLERGIRPTFLFLNFDVSVRDVANIAAAARGQKNFIVICSQKNTDIVINKAKALGRFAPPYTWVVASENIPASVVGYDITPDMQFTLMALRFGSFQWIDFTNAAQNAPIFESNIQDMEMAKLCPELDSDQELQLFISAKDTYSTYFSLVPDIELLDVFFSVVSNHTESVKFAHWNQVSKLFLLEFLDKRDRVRRMCGRRIIVSIFQHAPYTFLRKENGVLHVKGYLKEMFDMLFDTFNIRYSLIEIEEVFGVYNETSRTFDGYVGYLFRKEADMGMNVLGPTLSRSRGLRYIGPVTKAYLAIIYNRPDAVMPATTYLLPFSLPVWIYALTLFAGIVVTVFLVMLTSPSYKRHFNQSQVVHKPAFRAVTFAFLEEVFEYPPGISAKVVYGTLAVGTLVLFAHYTSVFTSFLTYQEEKVPFKSLEDVVKNREYQVLMVKNGRHQDLFESANSGVYAQVWKRIKKQGQKSFEMSFYSGLMKSYTGKYSYLSDGPTCTFLSGGNCSVAFAPCKYYHEFYNMAHRHDFPYSRMFTLGLMQIMESGIFRRLTLTYRLDSRQPCRFGGNSTLGLQQVIGIFVLLGFGMAASVLITLLERSLSPKWAMKKLMKSY